MDKDTVGNALSLSKTLLEEGGTEDDFAFALQQLSAVLSTSSKDEMFRVSLGEDITLLDLSVDIVTNSLSLDFKSQNEAVWHTRLLRGVLLCLRNMMASTKSVVDLPLLLLNIQHFVSKIGPSNPFFLKCLSAYIEVLANMALSQGNDFKCNIQLVSHTFDPILNLVDREEISRQPLTIFLNGCLRDDDNVSSLLTDEANANLLDFVLTQGYRILEQDNLECVDNQVLLLHERLITNKSFKIWLQKKENHKDFMSILKVSQLVATLEKEWDNIQCTLIMEWSVTYLQEWSALAVELLYADSEQQKLAEVHSKLIIVLDVISDLLKYHLAKQFLEHYNAIEPLIRLFRAAHEMGESLTISPRKTQVELGSEKKKKHFPLIKSLIVEILAYIVHSSFESQEKMRELHGLELLLSNCIIDDNNPYIKERSILCLRFVLENNFKNQDFVAQLEAKQVVDDQALQEVGYEVNVEDGQVKLKKT